MQAEISQLFKKYAFGIILLVFVSLFFTDAVFLSFKNEPQVVTKTCFSNLDVNVSGEVLKISDISGPMIDEQAVSISCQETIVTGGVQACNSLPAKIWIFLLFAYTGLLVFNLAYDFKKTSHVRWAWESFLTGVFLLGWVYFDQCVSSLWFPLYILKVFVITYLAYLYFFVKIVKK